MGKAHLSISLAALAAIPFAAPATGSPGPAEGRGFVAVRAGTIYLVTEGKVIEGGGTVLVKGDRIHSVGADVAVPADAQVVDYGPDAVVIPGLVAADTSYGSGTASPRTAEPDLRAIDNFDFYAKNAAALSAGVTTVYLKPTDMRLIGGEGALVKLAGADADRRTLRAPATVHGAIHAAARNTQGYWEPPVPATVDVGIGYAKPQLPKSPMGAIVALNELLAAARGGDDSGDFGPYAAGALKKLVEAKVPWRITAQTESELRAILDFASEGGVPLVIEGAAEAGELAEEIAAAGVPVIFELPWTPNRGGLDRGKGEDVVWPSYDAPSKLVEAGARVAIASASTADLLFAASAASQGKLDAAAALRAITLTPAEIYGVADRVGSLEAGKDADMVVLNGPPIALGTSVVATWIDGQLAWDLETSGARGRAKAEGETLRPSASVTVQVDELHLGDGRVLSPGQVVIRNGRIVSVSQGHGASPGTKIVRGVAAMPGIIDALGHLGLEGSRRVPNLDTDLRTILAPGDATDRRVARSGITTVALAARGTGGAGSPVQAYKPAARYGDRQSIGEPTAVRMTWTDSANRRNSGKAVRDLLKKGKDYKQKWEEYEAAMASWTPPAPEPKEEEEDEDEKDDEKSEDDDEKKDDKKKKKKKDEEEEVEPDPITGIWVGQVERPPLAETERLRMQLQLTVEEGGGPITGNLRCAAVTDGLIDVEGYYDGEEHSVALKGLGSQGWVSLQATYKEAKLTGTLSVGSTSIEVEIERTSRDYVVAKRSEQRAAEEEPAPKGMPKAPREDPKLEPVRAALEGRVQVVVNVDREDEILDCVATFAAEGIHPVLFGATGAHLVAGDIAGRVAGVLLPHTIRASSTGTDVVNPYARLQDAGIPVAFHSAAEEGAIDLPMMAMYAIANGMSATGALRALTADAADMLSIEERVGRLQAGADGDVLLLDGPPLAPGTSVVRVWVNGLEVTP